MINSVSIDNESLKKNCTQDIFANRVTNAIVGNKIKWEIINLWKIYKNRTIIIHEMYKVNQSNLNKMYKCIK